jgi:hypothetical protein
MTEVLRKLHDKVEGVNSSPKSIWIANQNEMGRAHDTHGRKCLQEFGTNPPNLRDLAEYLRVILKWN